MKNKKHYKRAKFPKVLKPGKNYFTKGIPTKYIKPQNPPWWKTYKHHFFYFDTVTVDKQAIFEFEYKKWKEETFILSTTDKIFGNEHFNNIVNMGKDAVPFIHNKLKTDNTSWFLVEALNRMLPNVLEITGYVPLNKIVETWIVLLDNAVNI